MSNTELLIEEIMTLPTDFMEEVLQFIIHLKQKKTSEKMTLPPAYSTENALIVSAQKKSAPDREPISRYFGCLKNSKAFSGDPVEIQRQMRAEWEI